jgi:hypothetical protein
VRSVSRRHWIPNSSSSTHKLLRGKLCSLSLFHSVTQSLISVTRHTNTQSHSTTLLLPPQHPHRYLLTHSLHLNAATGRYAHSGSLGHSALLGLHNRGAIHHVSAGRSHFSLHCLHCTVLLILQGDLSYSLSPLIPQ